MAELADALDSGSDLEGASEMHETAVLQPDRAGSSEKGTDEDRETGEPVTDDLDPYSLRRLEARAEAAQRLLEAGAVEDGLALVRSLKRSLSSARERLEGPAAEVLSIFERRRSGG